MMLEVILLLLSIPTGFLIAWLARDELVSGRKWIRTLGAVSIIVALAGLLYEQHAWTYTCFFILMVCVISLWKSHNPAWAKSKV